MEQQQQQMEVRKADNLDISEVLKFMQGRGYFLGFDRYVYDDYDTDHALRVVEAIGRVRNPRFVIDSENRFAYENFIKWCHGDSSMRAIDPISGKEIRGDLRRGIYIAGNTGTGKSWCLEIMLLYAQASGFEIQFSGETNRPLFWAIKRADEICQEYVKSGDTQPYKQMQILGIQDFGQEQNETLYMGNRQNVLGQILEYRGDMSDKLTLITSNLRISSETLRSVYGDRVQSRLVEMCNYLEIKGKDRRQIR